MSGKERILIVDDDINVIKSMALIFGKKGYETETACTGQEALKKAKENFFNIALLDIKLPDMDGIELITPLKEMHPDMGVIMVTGYASVDNAVRALNEGAAAYNTKPLDMDTVLMTVKNVVEKQHLVFEKRQVEESLQESEEMLSSFMESATDIFILFDSNLNFIEINKAGLKTWDVDKKDVIGKNLLDISPNLKKNGRYDQYLNVIKTGMPFFIDDVVPDPKFGNKHLSIRAFKVGDGFGMIITDITDRKNAEEKLRRSEENYRTLFNMSPEAILWIDTNGNILDCNEATTALVGLQKTEIVGNSFNNLEFLYGNSDNISKKKQVMIKRGNYVKSGLIEYKLSFNGNNRWLEIFPALLKMNHNNYALQAVIRDITERKRGEEQLKASLTEKEVLLKEIHHRVKNNMQVISSMLNLQIRNINDEQIIDIFQDSQNRIKSMALVHEGLYQSKDLASVNFANYIKRLTRQLFNSRGINSANIGLKLNVREALLDINTAIPCGLILNELVSNALKHAFPDGKTGEIYIGLATDSNDEMNLIIMDNGAGFPQELDFRNTNSFGLQLVNTLVDQISGTIELEREKGTIFTIKFKRPEFRNGDKEK